MIVEEKERKIQVKSVVGQDIYTVHRVWEACKTSLS